MSQRLKGWLKPLVNFASSPHQLGLAFGLGIFLGVIPGTGALVAAAVAAVLRLNLPVMVAGALVTNPLTAPVIYVASYGIGSWLLGDWLPVQTVAKILVGTAAGNLLLAAGLGISGYFLARILTKRLRK